MTAVATFFINTCVFTLTIFSCVISKQLPNILFIVVDDLRPDLGGFYGENDIVYTPNLDALMDESLVFTHAYCQQALCSPSRTSFLTGQRPDTSQIWSIGPYFRKTMFNNTGYDVITIPQFFKQNGYYTVGSGKVFHPGTSSGGNKGGGGADMPYSWDNSQAYWFCDQFFNQTFESPAMQGWPNMSDAGCVQDDECITCLESYDCWYPSMKQTRCETDCPLKCYQESAVANNTIKYFEHVMQQHLEQLDQSNQIQMNHADRSGATNINYRSKLGIRNHVTHSDAEKNINYSYSYSYNYADVNIIDENGITGIVAETQPFFIAVGLKRPHLSWFAPQKWFDMYPTDQIRIAKHTMPPYNMPFVAFSNGSGFDGQTDCKPYYYDYPWSYDGEPNITQNIKLMNTSYHAYLRSGYYATISFMDEQLGVIMDKLRSYPSLWNNTIVVFLGDHGYHLGEQGSWAKFTNFEVATRVPLMFRVPNLTKGEKTDVLVELVDIFPTLLDATGLSDKFTRPDQLEGKSLWSVINKPNGDIDWPQYTYSQYPREHNIMGLSLRTVDWRYTEWVTYVEGNSSEKFSLNWNVTHGIELYNHTFNQTNGNGIDENDMNAYDNVNLAYNKSDDIQNLVKKLHDILYQTWDKQNWTYSSSITMH